MNLLCKYQLVEKIAANSRYDIYRGIDQLDQKSVLLKMINPQLSRKEATVWLQNEFEILNNINVSGVVKPYALEVEQDRITLILENFVGQDLTQFLTQGKLTLEYFIAIAIQLATILTELHQNQIIHQNLQPSSILINSDTLTVKITNFGAATKINQEKSQDFAQLEEFNLSYISPEQTGRMNVPLDYRSDFYSLGIIFYQMLTGKPPHNAKNLLELIHCHVAKTPRSPSQIDPAIPETISQIVMKLLAKNPDDRYQTPEGIKVDLEKCQYQYLEQGEIELFELGTIDQHSQFIISPKFYGRSSVIEAIISSFERVNSGAAETILVKGNQGTGKTSLIEKVVQPMLEGQGCFIAGKFEQLKSNIPYEAITQAFRGLIQQLLTKPQDHLQIWQKKIAFAIGNNGKVITNFLPELELIIGSQPDIVELPAKETQNRFNTVFVKFLQVFTEPTRPLVIFLDDLQWADSASLNLIEALQNDFNSKYILIIGAYCDQELDTAHSLNKTIRKLHKTVSIKQVALQPLTLEQINLLVFDTLHCREIESFPLAELLFNRTQGNPFFVHQLLRSFYKEKLLTFDFISLKWRWSIKDILTMPVTNYDVLALVCRGIFELPETCQQILKLASCIGNQFDLVTLRDIWQVIQQDSLKLRLEEIIEKLDSALQTGIIVLDDQQSVSTYKFLHDRVYQATYALLKETERIKVHYEIGQLLLQQTPADEIEEKIFALVYHLNLGRKLLAKTLFQDRLAELNLIAAKKAKATNAYEVAANYLDIALESLAPSTWEDNYQLIFAVHLEATEVQYLLANFIRAEQLGNIVLFQAKTVLEKIRLYKIKIHAYIAQDQMRLAIDLGFDVLELLEISVTDDLTNSSDPESNLNSNRDYSVESLRNLPAMTDNLSIAAMEILTAIIPPVYIAQPQSFPVVVMKMVDLCLEYGNSKFSAFAYSLYGSLLCVAGDIDAGYQIGKLALTFQQQFNAKEIKSRVEFTFNNMIRHWREPAINTLEHFLTGIESGIEVGCIEDACFHATRYCVHLFCVGEPLAIADEKSLNQINLINHFKQDFQLNYTCMWRQLNLNLRGLADDKFLLIGNSFDESKILAHWLETNDAMSLFSFYLIKLYLCYTFKDYQQAILYARQANKYRQASVGLIGFGVYHFYYSLAMLAMCSDTDTCSTYLPEILLCQQQLKRWRDHAPANYLNKYELVTAEIARVSEEYEQAAEHYDQAITEANRAGYIHESALAAELAGEFYLSKGRNRIAEFYLTDACQKYSKWDALAKVEDLQLRYAQLLADNTNNEIITNKNKEAKATTSISYGISSLDLLSAIKASQAISSEIILDNLLSKMIEIVMENAGAQKSVLLLEENSALVVAASATVNTEVDAEEKVTLPHVSISEYEDIPISLVNYIQSTHKTVILENAAQEGMFANDSYMIKHQPKSILGCPMIYKNNLQGIIYLENSLIRGAFTPQKLEVLQVLLSQVSISIENAHLYKNLKDHASVQKSLKQKEILLKEIHHRVKNNLFVVSSLLDFQSSYVDDPEVIKLLSNCQNRIASMALVHQHLYGNSELDKINFAQYIESLLDNLAYSQGTQERNINLNLDLDPVELNIESANPCGLIVNELVSNALEHGFNNRTSGNIWLRLQRNHTSQIVLTVEDDGVGFKEDLDLHNNDSLGLELVCTLVEQIDGKISLDKTNGTKIEIIFDELDYHSRI